MIWFKTLILHNWLRNVSYNTSLAKLHLSKHMTTKNYARMTTSVRGSWVSLQRTSRHVLYKPHLRVRELLLWQKLARSIRSVLLWPNGHSTRETGKSPSSRVLKRNAHCGLTEEIYSPEQEHRAVLAPTCTFQIKNGSMRNIYRYQIEDVREMYINMELVNLHRIKMILTPSTYWCLRTTQLTMTRLDNLAGPTPHSGSRYLPPSNANMMIVTPAGASIL